MLALPQQRQCRITDALPFLEDPEHYRQAVLIVETGVLCVEWRVGYSLNNEKKKVFGGCLWRCLRPYSERCRLPPDRSTLCSGGCAAACSAAAPKELETRPIVLPVSCGTSMS